MSAGGAEPGPTVRIAAAGDIHCRESQREQVAAAIAKLRGDADLVLLAGDLTTHGEPQQAAVMADACRDLDVPVVAVLGNHDYHVGAHEQVTDVLADAGILVLDRDFTICEVAGCEIGVVGTKGFVGGFAGANLPDFGEPLLRQVYAETTAEVEAIERGLRGVAHCPFRIVLLHYAPVTATLEGEREDIWTFLGTDRMAAPIQEHGPDLVLHGHAHAGRFEAAIAESPVYNVSVPVMGRDFWLFELTSRRRPTTPIH